MTLEDVADLLPNDNYRLTHLTVVSPYLSAGFIESVIDQFGDQVRINLVLDQNCPRSSIEEVLEETDEKCLGRLRFSKSSGLVHAKLYWFVFQRNSGKRRYRRHEFLFGSLNATVGGWERNAEVSAAINLYSRGCQEQREHLGDYFNSVLMEDRVSALRLFVNNVTVDLPEMSLEDFQRDRLPAVNNTFDNWLQKGILAHAYNSERFARFEVKLKGRAQRNPQVPGWDIKEAKTVAYGYTEIVDTGNGEERWKSRYFVDTIYGTWASYDCYNSRKHGFVKGGAERRAGQITFVRGIEESQSRQDVVSKCMEAFDQIVDNDELKPLLEVNGKGTVDLEFYRQSCIGQIEKHIRKANDPLFEDRYTKGYEFNELPPLLECEALWTDFLESFFETVLYGIRNRIDQVPTGYFARVLKEELDLDGEEDWHEVYDDVVQLWEDDEEFRESLINYWNRF